MSRILQIFILLVLVASGSAVGEQAVPMDSKELVKKIQGELVAPVAPVEAKLAAGVPHGEIIQGTISDSRIFPGTENPFQVYVPAQYHPAKPACLLLRLDGWNAYESTVLDNLIASKEIPVMIGIGISPGELWKLRGTPPKRQAVRFNRSYEFDSVNDHFPEYVLNELLPAVQKLTTRDGRSIKISTNGNDHAAMGGSTGGIGAFTLAWQRPDQFTRIYSFIGTFVAMRGGNEYPALIRKTEPKPIRVFLEDGTTDAWNPLFGSWYEANLDMETALTFAGYDVAHAWGTHGHDGQPGMWILPDVLRWLWRDYPASVKRGASQNTTLREINVPGMNWQTLQQTFQGIAGMAANNKGEVYASDGAAGTVSIVSGEGTPTIFSKENGDIAGVAFGPDGTLYGVVPGERKIVALNQEGTSSSVSAGVTGRGIVVTHDGTLYVSEPGAHSDTPSRVWRIHGGEKKVVDEGLRNASGIAFSPDSSLFYTAEKSTQWIYSFAVETDGSLSDRQQHDWLHMTDIPNDSGAEDLAVDTNGNLYAATRMGVQICDQAGRVRAILPLPAPCGPVRSLCFGGKQFDVLYVTDGAHIYKRKLKIHGFPQWSAPVAMESQGPY